VSKHTKAIPNERLQHMQLRKAKYFRFYLCGAPGCRNVHLAVYMADNKTIAEGSIPLDLVEMVIADIRMCVTLLEAGPNTKPTVQ